MLPEIVNCYTLRHEHILSLRGIYFEKEILHMVFQWKDRGDAVQYMHDLIYATEEERLEKNISKKPAKETENLGKSWVNPC